MPDKNRDVNPVDNAPEYVQLMLLPDKTKYVTPVGNVPEYVQLMLLLDKTKYVTPVGNAPTNELVPVILSCVKLRNGNPALLIVAAFVDDTHPSVVEFPQLVINLCSGIISLAVPVHFR